MNGDSGKPDPKPKNVLDWLGVSEAPDWAKARWLGAGVGALIFLLFGLALAALFGVLIHTIVQAFSPGTEGPNLGAGALIAALLGAPFVIWGTWLKHQTVRYQKEGHITDRINKAVEMLGAEKSVDRIGRPVTIWTGKPEISECKKADVTTWEARPRTKITPKEWKGEFPEYGAAVEQIESESENGRTYEVRTWPAARTVVEYQGTPIELAENEIVGIEGDWDVFSESVPNIEVRIGAILSLERIAQDSTNHDKGRDHVRVMEILCAYIRENAPASGVTEPPFWGWNWTPPKKGATNVEIQSSLSRRIKSIGSYVPTRELEEWVAELPRPREDVALALAVIARRTDRQRIVEALWSNIPTTDIRWVFDHSFATLSRIDFATKEADFSARIRMIRAYSGYRIDLQRTNLQKADLSSGAFSGACLAGARLEGANLAHIRLEGANLERARLDKANLSEARLDGANLKYSQVNETIFRSAKMSGVEFHSAKGNGAIFESAQLFWANLDGATMCYADFDSAEMSGASLEQSHLMGANMEGAQMEGVSLYRANLKRANLKKGQLKKANISNVEMDGATLYKAHLEGANLSGALLKEANLSRALMPGANLKGANLERADLSAAMMYGADLSWAKIDGANFKNARLRGAALRGATPKLATFSAEQLTSFFADGTVVLANDAKRPPQWSNLMLFDDEFYEKWRKWQADPENYTPPPKP